MARGEQKRAIFIGPTLISIGNIMFDNKTILFKKVPSNPIRDRWVPIMGNIEEVPKERRKIFIPAFGETEMEVEIYWCDLKFNEYCYTVHPEHLSELKNLRTENAMLKLKINKILNRLYNMENEDLGKKHLKDEIKWLNSIKNPYLGNEGGAGSPFGSPFQRF